MINWIPRVLGSMMLRPGMAFLASSKDDAQAVHLPFVFSIDDKAIVELTDLAMRVWIDDTVVTRASVSTFVTNGAFDYTIDGWTDADEGTAKSFWSGADTYTYPAAYSTDGEAAMTMGGASESTSEISSAGLATMTMVGTTSALTEAGISADGVATMEMVGDSDRTTTREAAMSADGSSTMVADSRPFPEGYLSLIGTGSAFAIRRQEVTVSLADRNVEHGINIVIDNGPVLFRAGTSAGDDDLFEEAVLDTGAHSLAVTPTTGSMFLEFKSRLAREVRVDSCSIESAGIMVVDSPWATADLRSLRWDLSGDVFFVACPGYQQRRIERRSARSWSVVLYAPEDGPFRTLNVSPTTITSDGLTGNVTLTASKPFFRSGHVGGLFEMTSVGQTVTDTASADDNTSTNAIKVTGVEETRGFSLTLSGFGTATVTLQRSFDEEATWVDVGTYTADTSTTFDDGLDNQIIHYRLICKTGDYTSGNIVMTLAITTGGITGVARVTSYTSSTSVAAEVLSDLGGTDATEDWAEGAWSTHRGFPTSVAFHEGRLSWAGQDQWKLSISDAFDAWASSFEGDGGPIQRSIGAGPVDTINWLLSMQRLLAGAQMAEFSARSSSLDEPLTATNFNLKSAGTQGSAPVQAVKVDQAGVFVQRGGQRVYELAWGGSGIDYETSHLSALVPEIGAPEIVKVVVQRQPDTRLHFIRSDGTVAMLVFDKLENVICWLEIETDGVVEDAVVLPGDAGDKEDWVYYSVQRTINSETKRYLEKWAFESQVGNLAQSLQADSYVTYSQAASATISGLEHLEGEDVIVWDNGVCLNDSSGEVATFTVSSGAITATHLGAAHLATTGVVGLPFTGSWESAKLVELMADLQANLTDDQLIKGLALILADVHAKGVQFGPSLTESEMNDLPEISPTGATVDPDSVRTDYVMQMMAFPGGWTHDSRLCLLAKAPRPCTVLAALAEVNHHG